MRSRAQASARSSSPRIRVEFLYFLVLDQSRQLERVKGGAASQVESVSTKRGFLVRRDRDGNAQLSGFEFVAG